MIKNLKTVIAIISLIVLCSTGKAEEVKKLKYGKVTLDELQMTKYDQDTSAEAVVLYEYAEFIPNMFMFVEHYRIKVLKSSGTNYASMVFNGQIKSFIKGCTYNLENGAIVKTKLKSESIFEERVVANYFRTRISMPNVKVGSVFEIEITHESSVPSSLEIQWRIPVVYGAVIFPKHKEVDFRVEELGYLGYAFKGEDTWIVRDMPAFKNEPYITSDKDYRVRMEIEMISWMVSDPRYNRLYSMFLASSWEAVAKIYRMSDYLGVKVNELALYLNGVADSIKQKSSNEDELAKNAFDEIKKIHWNKDEYCFASQDIKKTFKQKEGNVADININLIILLRKLGLKSYPVLLSSRDNGKISKYLPSLHKLNYLIAAVELPSAIKYLDATDENLPYGLLPDRISCCLGVPLNDNKAECSVFIDPTGKNKKVTYSNLSVDSLGNIHGNVSIRRLEYNAVDFKNYLKSQSDHDSYIRDLETSNNGWTIDNYKFNNLNDPYKDFSSEYEVSHSTSIGTNDILVFSPLAFVKMESNPFQKDKRYLPISFPELTDYSSTVTISLPKNYVVSEIPKSIEVSTPDKTASFSFIAKNVGNSIVIKTKFNINKLNYATIEYVGLRGLYESMLQKFNESIVLKRS